MFTFTRAKDDFKDFQKKIVNHPYYKLGHDQTEEGVELVIK
jgi:hypothetical protein